MFGASQNYAQHVPSNLAQPGYSYWRAMELTLRSQWYILSLMESEGDVAVQRDMLISWSSDLISIVSTNAEPISAIQLVTHSQEKGSEGWCTRPVLAIWLGRDMRHLHQQGRAIPIFELSDGSRICDPIDRGSPSGLIDLQLLWRRPR